jgi:3'(2'), 5'-bisphosphate nucleotidase
MPSSPVDRTALLEQIVPIARKAGELILEIYAGDFEVQRKEDSSPVTHADERAEAYILGALGRLTPLIPVIAEEAVAAGGSTAVGQTFWLVDPLDGTKEFIKRNGEFTVNIALIEDGIPILGVVYAPALDRLFGGGDGLGAWIEEAGRRRPIRTRGVPAVGLTVVASRSHGDEAALDSYLADHRVASRVGAGSSLKFCLVAAGEADVYPRLGRTMEWDIAAGHAVLTGAGGYVCALDGAPLHYGKSGFENPHFVAWGTAQTS